MQLDFSKLNNLRIKTTAPEKTPFKNATEPLKSIGVYTTLTNNQKPIEHKIEGIDEIRLLRQQAKKNKTDKERVQEIYRQHQENSKKSETIQADILKGIRQGESLCSLFLKASKVIAITTGNTAFYNQVESEIYSIYGTGLEDPETLRSELEAIKKRLAMLQTPKPHADEHTKNKINIAIKKHQERAEQIKAIITGQI